MREKSRYGIPGWKINGYFQLFASVGNTEQEEAYI
jgi:hypothetical protein